MNPSFQKMRIEIFFSFLFSLFSFLYFNTAHAAPSYTVSPLVIDEKAEARDIIKKPITIVNTGDAPVTIYPTVNNISLKEGGTIEKFLAPAESDQTASLASWIEISRQGIDLQPGAKKELEATVRINPAPVPGTYHALIGFGYGGTRDEAERQIVEGRAPGIVVTVTIEDKKVEALKLSKFFVDRFVTGVNNQAAAYTFTNPGDETVVPKGEIILYNSHGEEVGTVPVNAESVTIEPGKEHVFTAALPTKGLFGKYKAFLSVEYGNTQRGSVQDTNFFYVFPLRNILVILALIVFCAGSFAWYVHKKYFGDEDDDDSERLMVRVREGVSDAKHHDIDLKNISSI